MNVNKLSKILALVSVGLELDLQVSVTNQSCFAQQVSRVRTVEQAKSSTNQSQPMISIYFKLVYLSIKNILQ